MLIRILIIISFFISCSNKYQYPISDKNENFFKETLLQKNKILFQSENKFIDSIIKISNLNFYTDSTGVRILIDKKNNNYKSNIRPKKGDVVFIKYSCIVLENQNSFKELLRDDYLNFKLGYSKQMRGLNFAIKSLKVGDEAMIIIPSYLGFGLTGYIDLVPPHSTILLNIKLLNIKS